MGFEINYAEKLAIRRLSNPTTTQPITGNNIDKISLSNVASVPKKQVVNSGSDNVEFCGLGIQSKKKFEARTFDSDTDFLNIPIRDWAINDYLRRGYINLLVAPGAVGKSALTIVEAISVATGKDLLCLGAVNQGNVLIINNEDDDDELNRRIAAVCRQYYINPKTELENRLFVRSGYGERVAVAFENHRVVEPTNQVPMLIDFIVENQITVLVLDPFISTHDSDENLNSQIDKVVDQYKVIAKSTGVAIRLVHHTKKLGDDTEKFAGDIEISRGASSLKDAARVCHTLTPMGNESANNFEIDESHRRRIIRIDDAKTNFSISDGEVKYFYKESVQIANGEWIGVPRPYVLPKNTKPEKETPESRKYKVINNLAMAALNVLGEEGGNIKFTKMRAEYMNITRRGSSTADEHCNLLPIGSSKAERVNLKGKYYHIFHVFEDKPRAPRFVYLQPHE